MNARSARITQNDNSHPFGALADADVPDAGDVTTSEASRTTTTSRAEEHSTSTPPPRRRHAQRELPPPTLTLAAGRRHTAETMLRAWLEGKAGHTVRSYRHDLDDFAVYLSRALEISPPLSVNEALTHLFHQSSPAAHEVAIGFRSHLRLARLSAASINRHLATLRSVTKLGRMLGMLTWYLEVPSLKPEQRRETRGPSVDEVRQMLAVTSGDTEAETRDAAILMTFYCLGLRVSELCGLNLEDTDLSRGTTWITGKARFEREPVPLPASVVEAIRRYLTHRGSQAGPLFQTVGNRGNARGGRLEGRSVLRIVCGLGRRVGLHVWCHGLRHSSITQATALGQRAGLGLERIRAHSRHRSIATLMTYVDEQNRTETQRSLADLVAGTLTPDVRSTAASSGQARNRTPGAAAPMFAALQSPSATSSRARDQLTTTEANRRGTTR